MLQHLGRKRLLEAGYIELGVDQFVLPGEALLQAQSAGVLQRQFMGYTPAHTQALVGLGVSALGATGSSYMQNEKNLQNYQTRVQQGQLPLQRGHLLSAQDIALRAHIMALLTTYRANWHSSDAACAVLQPALTRLAPLQADGLVELGERSITVTATGRPFLRTICMALDARLLARSPELVLGNSPL
jgi:oxygen-independent coproporphyrinogen-3 oxidase